MQIREQTKIDTEVGRVPTKSAGNNVVKTSGNEETMETPISELKLG